MAARLTFRCLGCGFSVDSWDDGNPYIEDRQGKRHHFYHPCEDMQIREIVGRILGRKPKQGEIDEMVKLHSGNESNFICTDCLKIMPKDPKKDALVCDHCQGQRLVRTHALAGTPCPACKVGRFGRGDMTAIS